MNENEERIEIAVDLPVLLDQLCNRYIEVHKELFELEAKWIVLIQQVKEAYLEFRGTIYEDEEALEAGKEAYDDILSEVSEHSERLETRQKALKIQENRLAEQILEVENRLVKL